MKIILVSDQPLTLTGLAAVVRTIDPAAQVITVGTQACGLDTVCEHADVALAVLDLDSAGAGWLDAAAWLAAADPTLPVAVIASSSEDDDVVRAIDSGAAGYLVKDGAIADLADALRALLAGHLVMPTPGATVH